MEGTCDRFVWGSRRFYPNLTPLGVVLDEKEGIDNCWKLMRPFISKFNDYEKSMEKSGSRRRIKTRKELEREWEMYREAVFQTPKELEWAEEFYKTEVQWKLNTRSEFSETSIAKRQTRDAERIRSKHANSPQLSLF